MRHFKVHTAVPLRTSPQNNPKASTTRSTLSAKNIGPDPRHCFLDITLTFLVPDMAQGTDSSAMTVCEKVFSTVELLDNVLCCILDERKSVCPLDWENRLKSDTDPLRDTFLLERVNKTFYNHIRGETKVAQELYLTPSPCRTKRTFLLAEDSHLSEYACNVFDLATAIEPEPEEEFPSTMFFNILGRALHPPPQSWASLLISQPPIYKMWMWVFCRRKGCKCEMRPPPGKSKRRFLLHCPKGFTLGAIFKAAQEIAPQHRDCVADWKFHADPRLNSHWSLAGPAGKSLEEYYIKLE